MQLTIDVPDETVDALKSLAEAQGLKLEDWVRDLVVARTPAPVEEVSPEERLRRLHEWLDMPRPQTPLIPDEFLTREYIYADDDEA